jgi:thioredoxin 1
MKRKIFIIGAITIVALAGAFLVYFFYLENPSQQVLARVNDEKITVEQFNKELAKVENPVQDIYGEEPDKFLEVIIIKTLLLQEAKKQGSSAPVKTYKDAAKGSLSLEESIINEFIEKKFSSLSEVTHEEIERFYKMYKDQMQGKSLKEATPAIEQYIRKSKRQDALQEFLGELRSNAKIEIAEDRLKRIASKPAESNTEEDFKKALLSGKPVLVDFGANSCIPCRQMRPILKEVGKEYAGKASVLVIDVYKYQRLASDYGIRLIPTLIFFDSKGKEIFRNMGAMGKEKIVEKLREIGMTS